MKKVIAEYPHKICITLSGQKRAPYRIWYSVQSCDGKIQRVYVSASTREKAENVALGLVKEIEDSGLSLGKVLSKEEKAAIQQYQNSSPVVPLADLIKDGTRKSLSDRSKWTVERAVEHFVVEWKKKNEGIARSEIYQKSIKRHLDRFRVDFSGRQMFSLTLDEVREWRDSLSSPSQKVLTAKARNDYLSDVKRLFSHCYLSTVEELELLPKAVLAKDFYTIEETQKILDILRPYKEKGMHRCYATAILCLFAGLRQSEALALDWDVINKALSSSVEKSLLL